MGRKSADFCAIPTNIITGFLGVGKTSAILSLLKTKPEQERWAVLVNEFGEIGLDGRLMEGDYGPDNGVFIREVSGGCMCCTAGVTMQVALTRLLSEAKPDRLLIEPTGLGHPKEVLQTLSSEYYRDVLSIRRTVTLVDARKLVNPRYTSHQTFRQQIAMADIVVGNKTDLYEDGDAEHLIEFVRKLSRPNTPVIFSEHGRIALEELENQATLVPADEHEHHHGHHDHHDIIAGEAPFPEIGFIRAVNEGEGYRSVGWRFHPEKVFDREALFSLLPTIEAERLKAIFITREGIFGFNKTSDGLVVGTIDECIDSRIEIIADIVEETLEKELLACLTD